MPQTSLSLFGCGGYSVGLPFSVSARLKYWIDGMDDARLQ